MTLMRFMTAAALLAFPVAASAGYGSDDGAATTGCSTCVDHVSDDDDSSSGVKAAPCGEPSPCADDMSSYEKPLEAPPVTATYTPPMPTISTCCAASASADDASSDDDACGTACEAPKPSCDPCGEKIVVEPVVVHTVPQACAAPCVESCTPSACSAQFASDLRAMYDANLTELRFASLALTRTSDDDTADYLRDIQADRSRANERVIALADDTCIDLGPGPSEASLQSMLAPFRGECGPCLDQNIVAHAVRLEQDNLALAESAHGRLDAIDRDNDDIDDVDDFAAWQVTELNRTVDRGTMLEDDLTG